MDSVQAGNRARSCSTGSPRKLFEGWVESTSGGTGSVFSLFPPDNATGNFVRVVQRLPVRIRFAEAENYQNRIRPGMSATVRSTTRPSCAAATACGELGKEDGVGTKTQIAVTAVALLMPVAEGGAPRWRLALVQSCDRADAGDTLPLALPEQPDPEQEARLSLPPPAPPRRAGPSGSRNRWP